MVRHVPLHQRHPLCSDDGETSIMDAMDELLIDKLYDAVLKPERWQATLERLRTELPASSHDAPRRGDSASGPQAVTKISLAVVSNVNGHRAAGGDRDARISAVAMTNALDNLGAQPAGERLHRIADHALLDAMPGNVHLPSTRQSAAASDADWETRLRRVDDPTAAPLSALSGDALGALEKLEPHLKNCMDIRARLRQLETGLHSLTAALDVLGHGIVLLDRHGGVAHCNAQAGTLLGQTCPLMVRNGRLRARKPRLDKRLQELIAQALGGELNAGAKHAGTLSAAEEDEEAGLRVLVCPAGSSVDDSSAGIAGIVLLSQDAPLSLSKVAFLLRRFALTRSETRCAMLFASGCSIDEVGSQLHTTRNTVKAHLRSLFSKTGAKRQAALVAILNRELAAFNVIGEPGACR